MIMLYRSGLANMVDSQLIKVMKFLSYLGYSVQPICILHPQYHQGKITLTKFIRNATQHPINPNKISTKFIKSAD